MAWPSEVLVVSIACCGPQQQSPASCFCALAGQIGPGSLDRKRVAPEGLLSARETARPDKFLVEGINFAVLVRESE